MKKQILLFIGLLGLAACSNTFGNKSADQQQQVVETPNVDYIEKIDPYSSNSNDMFLQQLTMNYKSYALYNARTAGFPDIGEIFAKKAMWTYSGQRPAPESLEKWNISDSNERFDLQVAHQTLTDLLTNDLANEKPKLAAEAQAKFDCWLSAAASGQTQTADECKQRFNAVLTAISSNGDVVKAAEDPTTVTPNSGFKEADNAPAYSDLSVLTDTDRTREGVVIVNNINIPSDLVARPAVALNQNIYGSNNKDSDSAVPALVPPISPIASDNKTVGNEMVSRDEFINMMMSLRNEIQEINKRLDEKQQQQVVLAPAQMPAPVQEVASVPQAAAPVPVPSHDESATIKVQQMSTEMTHEIAEETLEVHFDFNKAAIKREYDPVIQKLAASARDTGNMRITITGFTDTSGTKDYNFDLGARRALAVKQMLISQGVPEKLIKVISKGEYDLKVPTKQGVKNAENRRVKIKKREETQTVVRHASAAVAASNIPQDK